jgi:hypothetical protein
MGHLKSFVGGTVLAVLVGTASAAQAQSLGTFTWQLQPFCNRVTVSVTQNGTIYTLDGFDDQCGAPQRAPLVGLATPNPDGSIGLGFHIATSPGGKTVSVEARISLATVGGPWTDSAGNSGTLALNGAAAGSARPAPPAGVSWGMSVTSPTNGGTGLRLKSARTGTVVQPAPALIVEGFSPSTEDHFGYAGVLSTTNGGDAMAAYSDAGNGLVAVAGGTGPVGSAAVFARASGAAFAVRAESYSVRPAIYAQNFAGPAIEVQGGNAPAIAAAGGSGLRALEVSNGGISVGGTVRPAFMHTTTAGTIIGSRSVIDHPLLNGQASAIVVASYLFTPSTGVIAGGFNVLYDSATARWSVMRSDGSTMPVGARFNVIVFNQ